MQPESPGIAVLAGDGQRALPGALLPDSAVVEVLDPAGHPLAGVAVQFAASDQGRADPAVDTTDAAGVARTRWTLGPAEHEQTLGVAALGREPASLHASTEPVLHAVTVSASNPTQDGTFTGCALDAARQAWCWKLNAYADFEIPDPPPEPVRVGSGLTFSTIQGGDDDQTCGLTTDSVVYCWRFNQPDRDPRPIPGMPPVVSLDVSQDGDWVCGLTAAAALYCYSPYFTGPTATEIAAARGYDFRQVVYGTTSSCGLDGHGRVYCWGSNSAGQYGNGTTSAGTSIPQLVPVATRFRSIASGGTDVCGVAETGLLYCWGFFWREPFANSQPHLSPTITVLPVARQVTLSWLAGFVLSAEGELYWWGTTPHVDIGPVLQAEPDRVPGTSAAPGQPRFTAVAGGTMPCAVSETGGVYCWLPSGRSPQSGSYYDHWRVQAISAPSGN